MPAVPVRFTCHGLPPWTSLLAAQKLCVGEDAREGGSCPPWYGAQGTKGLSEKDPLAIGHPPQGASELQSFRENLGPLVFECFWGRSGGAADSESLPQRPGWVPGTGPGAGQ